MSYQCFFCKLVSRCDGPSGVIITFPTILDQCTSWNSWCCIVYEKGKIGNFYNIGSNLNVDNLKICNLLIKIAKTKIFIGKNVKIKFVKDRPGHDLRYALNSNKIIKNLRWKTKIGILKGLEKTFNWYFKNPDYFSKLKKTDITRRLGNKSKWLKKE